MKLERMRLRNAVGVALFGALLVAACETDNVTDLTEDRPVLKVVLSPGDAVYPSGSVALSKAVVSGFDFSVSDGFERGTGAGGLFGSVVTAAGTFGGVNLGGAVRNSSQDVRLPILLESSAVVGGHFGLFKLRDPDDWDLWGELQGLEPSTVYTVVLARMTLRANGELDQHQVLTGNPVDQPDALSFAAGETQVYGNVVCNFDVATPVTAEMNPVALGVIETDASGNGTVDCWLRASPGDLWPQPGASADDFTAGNTPFGSNEPGAMVGPGQFNYLLLYEGAPSERLHPGRQPHGAHAAGPRHRHASGNVINNALASFPGRSRPQRPGTVRRAPTPSPRRARSTSPSRDSRPSRAAPTSCGCMVPGPTRPSTPPSIPTATWT